MEQKKTNVHVHVHGGDDSRTTYLCNSENRQKRLFVVSIRVIEELNITYCWSTEE